MFFVNAYFFTAVNLLLAGLKQPLAIAEGGEKGVAGERVELGKVEMLERRRLH